MKPKLFFGMIGTLVGLFPPLGVALLAFYTPTDIYQFRWRFLIFLLTLGFVSLALLVSAFRDEKRDQERKEKKQLQLIQGGKKAVIMLDGERIWKRHSKVQD